MEELTTILEENAEVIRAAMTVDEAVAILREKGIEVTGEQLSALAGPVELSDNELDQVSGGSCIPLTAVQGFGQMLFSRLFRGKEPGNAQYTVYAGQRIVIDDLTLRNPGSMSQMDGGGCTLL